MQKLVYLSNSRDFTNQKDVNENRYFKQINELLEQGWTVANALPNLLSFDLEPEQKSKNQESTVAFVVLEKPDEVR